MQKDKAKRFYVLLWTSVVLALGGVVGAKPAYHWYAHRRAIEIVNDIYKQDLPRGDWASVSRKLRLATSFSFRAPEVLRLTAQVLSAADKIEALQYYARLVETGTATLEDRLEYARQALHFNRPDVSRTLARDILAQSPVNVDALLIGTEALTRLGLTQDASRLAEATLQTHPTNEEAILRLGVLRSLDSDEKLRQAGRKLLWGLAIGQGPFRTKAVEHLATETTLTRAELIVLAKAMEYQTNRNLTQDLVFYDLRHRLAPESERGPIAALVVQRLGEKATPTERIMAADWLLNHGASLRVSEVLTESMSRQSSLAAERWIQAKANLDNWAEVNDLVEDFTIAIPPAIRHCFRAVIQNRSGNTNAVISHLTQAVTALNTLNASKDEAAQNDPSQILVVAKFAEQLRQPKLAAAAYDKLLPYPTHAAQAAREIFRTLALSDDVQQVLVTLRRLREFQPTNLEIADALSWGELLTRQRVPENAALCLERLAKYPNSDRFRITAALGHIRQNNPDAAIALLEARYPDRTDMPGRARLLYVAALGNAGQRQPAERLAATLDLQKFKSEELEMIRPWREELNR